MIVKDGQHLDNRYVVPYMPWFCQKYNCHINGEVCLGSIQTAKYLFKYLHKGGDRAMAASVPVARDEIAEFQDLKSMGSSGLLDDLWVPIVQQPSRCETDQCSPSRLSNDPD